MQQPTSVTASPGTKPSQVSGHHAPLPCASLIESMLEIGDDIKLAFALRGYKPGQVKQHRLLYTFSHENPTQPLHEQRNADHFIDA